MLSELSAWKPPEYSLILRPCLSRPLRPVSVKRVVLFGTFDSLHDGHRSLFRHARSLGDQLIVVAARDSYIRLQKHREPRRSAEERFMALQQEPTITQVMWGDEWPNAEPWRLLRDLEFEVLVLGYDQEPAPEVVTAQLAAYGKSAVAVVRLDEYPSSSEKIR